MATDRHKYRLGLFILAGLALLGGVLFALGGNELFQSKVKAVAFFDESVQGLDAGSPVKLRGVPIGKVTAIHLREVDNYIEVNMVLYLESSGLRTFAEVKRRIGQEIAKGAVCQLEYAGITGMKYIEIDYAPDIPRTPNPAPGSLPADVLHLPASKSALSSLSANVMNTLSRLAQIDLEGIATNLSETLAAAGQMLRSEETRGTLRHLNAVSGKLDVLVTDLQVQFTDLQLAPTLQTYREAANQLQHLVLTAQTQLDQVQAVQLATDARSGVAELRTTIEQVQTTLKSYEKLADATQQQVTAAQVPATAAEARAFLRQATQATRSLGDLQRDVRLALVHVADTLAMLEEWARALDSDPAALLRGKAPATPQEKTP